MISSIAAIEPVRSTLNDRIRQARLAQKLSRATLAQLTGVGPGAVAQWEHPEGTSPSVEHLISIAIQTDVAFEWLATGRGPHRLHAGITEISALMPESIALNLFEEQMLLLCRRIPHRHRSALLTYLAVVYPMRA
jgi:transcriptional regulator with XRE-family HTH domain